MIHPYTPPETPQLTYHSNIKLFSYKLVSCNVFARLCSKGVGYKTEKLVEMAKGISQ